MSGWVFPRSEIKDDRRCYMSALHANLDPRIMHVMVIASHALVFRGLVLPPPSWGGGNSSPLKTIAWEASDGQGSTKEIV